jgi:hypothetical protein
MAANALLRYEAIRHFYPSGGAVEIRLEGHSFTLEANRGGHYPLEITFRGPNPWVLKCDGNVSSLQSVCEHLRMTQLGSSTPTNSSRSRHGRVSPEEQRPHRNSVEALQT